MSDTVVDTFPLSPMQNGMLFHRLEGGNVGVDIEQMVGTLREPLDTAAFTAAWGKIAARHPVLRSRFKWDGLEKPVQEILGELPPPVTVEDLRGKSAAEQIAAVERYLEHDRLKGFDLDTAPLWHVKLFRTQEHEHRIVWTYSHALLDGCVSAVLREVYDTYEAALRNEQPTLLERRAYRDHIVWLQEHLATQREPARAHFKALLDGFDTPSSLAALQLPTAKRDPSLQIYGAKTFSISREASDKLRALNQQHNLRDPSLVEAAWALVVSAFSGADDIVFASTRACRRSSVKGADDTIGLFINTLPVRVKLDPKATALSLIEGLRAQQVASRPFEHTPLVEVQAAAQLPRGTPLFDTLVVVNDVHNDTRLKALGGNWLKRDLDWRDQTSFGVSLMAYGDPQLHFKLSYDRRLFDEQAMNRIAALTAAVLEAIAADASQPLEKLPRLPAEDAAQLTKWNETAASRHANPPERCIHRLFEAQAKLAPDRNAVVFRDSALTYRQLDEKSNQLAHQLRALGVGPDVMVGLFIERSLEMMVSMLAVLKAGGAYVPMDPSYPSARIAMMLEDSKVGVVLTLERLKASLPPSAAKAIAVDTQLDATQSTAAVDSGVNREHLAYVIFTSGSTGRPKGAQIRHRNVVSFFDGMDTVLEHDPGAPGTWLALTSISFDISVLELLWTLTRGFTVVVQEDENRGRARPGATAGGTQFSLFYFASDSTGATRDRYRLLLEGAKFADTHDFAAVWTPERHFHPFGGLYPNPSVTSAAIAAVTKRIGIRAGSVVLPLHNPIRCAEEWSVVDNLSNGRVGLSFASGWHASDFALAPQNFADRRKLMAEGIETIRALFRGEKVKAKSGDGSDIEVKMYPPSVQKEPRLWVTAGGSPETFAYAGKVGASILTNLLVMKPEDLVTNIKAYRAAYVAGGHAGKPHVTVMLHTFVGRDLDEVRATVRGPFLEYLRTSTDLINKAKWEKTAFAKGFKADAPAAGGAARNLDELSPEEMAVIMDHAFERYFKSAGLFGTPQSCLETVDKLKAQGVDEIACLVDFGVEESAVLESLEYLDQLRRLANEAPPAAVAEEMTIPSQIRRHQVTHMQCTPSLASILSSEPEAFAALSSLKRLLLGGEALPAPLVEKLFGVLTGALHNMYGPTETTIWSTSSRILGGKAPITIGRPLENQQVFIVDKALRQQPIGVPGELLIGGSGVVRGYLDRPELTAEKFVDLPYAQGKVYRTGDLARYRDDAQIEFLGRIDHQVKVRGYRIELGEIEANIGKHPAVKECVVVARQEGPGDARLVAYVVGGSDDAAAQAWRTLWDETYKQGERAQDVTFDVSGWKSSYTGEQIPDEEMRRWVELTVERIRSLGPRRVLEIGSGTGLLLYRIAPEVESYLGVDFADSAVAKIDAELKKRGIRQAQVKQGSADQLTDLPAASYDTIVINSVAQYFPDAAYLTRVLKRGLELLAPGGQIFIGDVRSLGHLEAFHTAIELERAPGTLGITELKQRVLERGKKEGELLLDPAFFSSLGLPELDGVDVRLKLGRDHNELTRFRYDVVLTKKGGARPVRVEAKTVALEPFTLEGARAALKGETAVRFVGVPNARLVREVEWAKQLQGSARDASQVRAAAAMKTGIEPDDLLALDPRFEADITWSAAGADRFDVVFHQKGTRVKSVPAAAAPAVLANVPVKRTNDSLGPELRTQLRDTLPDYMVPSAFVMLDALPRTPNGKIDRKALPAPDRARAETATAYAAPQSEVEEKIAGVWQELLALDSVGVEHNFFDLGANSLMMVQANGRLRTALGKPVSLVDMFRFPTVRSLAAHVSAQGGESAAAEDAIAKGKERGAARAEAMARRGASRSVRGK